MMRIARELLGKDRENADFQQLAGLALGISAAHLRDIGETRKAEEAYEECDSVFVRLVREHSDRVDARCLRAWYLWQHGELLHHARKYDGALAKYRLALQLYGDDFSSSPIYTRWRIGHGHLLISLSNGLAKLGELDQAEQFARQSVEEMSAVTKSFPNVAWGRQVYFSSQFALLDVLSAKGAHDEATAIGRRAATEWGDSATVNGDWFHQATLEFRLGKLLWWHGDHDEARRLLTSAKQRQPRPKLKVQCFLHAPDHSLRDYREALKLIDANKLDLDGEAGIAHYRLEQFDRARHHLQLELERYAEPLYQIYLAMTLQQLDLGEATEATRLYDQARARTSEPQYEYDDELHDVLKEASVLLGQGRSHP